MKIVFHPAADLEFREAIRYYRDIDPELAVDFEAKVEAGVACALNLPTLWREIEPGVRRVLLQRFPYGILYACDEDTLYVLAVMHLHRKPGYWHDRKMALASRRRTPGRRRR